MLVQVQGACRKHCAGRKAESHVQKVNNTCTLGRYKRKMDGLHVSPCETEDMMSNRIHKELATLKRKVKRLTKQLADLEHLVNVAIAHFPEVRYKH